MGPPTIFAISFAARYITFESAAMTTPCDARIYDCRCVGHDGQSALAALHFCSIPYCGATWVDLDHVVRLPRSAALPRRFGRPVLRSVA